MSQVLVAERGVLEEAERVLEDRGADQELLARIRALLRQAEPEVLEAGAIRIDLGTRRVTVGETPIALAGKEFALLCKLASAPTRVFPKDQLLREVWGFVSSARTRTVDSHASRLRRKLAAAAGGGEWVVNVWGVGYNLLDEL